VPVIVVSGMIGEERTADVIRAGARDVVAKDRLSRLPHVLARELREASERAERAQLASALYESQKRYRMTFEHASVGIVNTDRDARIIDVNERFAQIIGYSRAELIGRWIFDFSHPDDLVQTSAKHQQLADRRLDDCAYHRRYIHKDGHIVWASIRLSAVLDGGDLDYVIGLVEDITEKRASERQLAEAQEIAKVGSWTEDVLTGHMVWSDQHFRLHGLPITPPAPAEADMWAVVHRDDRAPLQSRYAALRRGEEGYDVEYRVFLPDGSLRRLRSRARIEVDAGGRSRQIVGATHDITEAKEREKELETLVLQHAAAANLGQFALTGASTPTVFAQAVIFANYMLNADDCDLFEVTADGYRRTSLKHDYDAWPPAEAQSALADHVLLKGFPLLIGDTGTETGVELDELKAAGFRSASMIPLTMGFAPPWGALGVYAREPNAFTESSVAFLQTIAPILGQAIESERARAALVASEQNYRNVVEGASELIFTVLPTGAIIALNPAFTVITGLETDAWIGRRVEELIAPSDRERVRQLTHTVVGGGVAASAEFAIVGRDGEVLLHVTTFPRVENGEVTAVYGFGRDITAERAAERERQTLTRNLQLLLDSTTEGIYTVDTAGRCTMVNRSFTEILGYSADEVIGVRTHDLVHSRRADGTPMPIEECVISTASREGHVEAALEDVLWRKDGTPVPVQLSAAPIIDRDVRIGAVITFTEVSERRKLEARLEQANRLSSLGRLAASVAHEFNNVLMGISPFVEVLRRNPAPDRAATALDQIGRSVDRGKRITEEILRFTRPAEPLRTSLDVRPWLETFLLDVRSMMPETISLTLEILPDAVHVEADPGQLHQVFLNLVLNARDAMPDGGPITIAVRIPRPGSRYSFGTVSWPERFAHFTVADCGSGIAGSSLQHVFEPLFTTKKRGTGLGLSVAHQIIQSHSGEIFVESQQGVGSAFHVFLPLAEETASQADASTNGTTGSLRTRRVLLVEDDPAVSDGLVAVLDFEGVEVTVARSGAEAFASLSKGLPDAVVLDVGLPDMAGTEVYRHIARHHPQLPVIFSTGHGDPAALEPYLAVPHVAMLRKPYDTARLLEALEEVLHAAARSRSDSARVS
ncbi:MAG: PAS domain S-box protein, partial [Thermoanaerobaculia bacterium]